MDENRKRVEEIRAARWDLQVQRGLYLNEFEGMSTAIDHAFVAYFGVSTNKQGRFLGLLSQLRVIAKIDILSRVIAPSNHPVVTPFIRRLRSINSYRNSIVHGDIDLEIARQDPRSTDNQVRFVVTSFGKRGPTQKDITAHELGSSARDVRLASVMIMNIAGYAMSVRPNELEVAEIEKIIIESKLVDDGPQPVHPSYLDLLKPIGEMPEGYEGPLPEDFDY